METVNPPILNLSIRVGDPKQLAKIAGTINSQAIATHFQRKPNNMASASLSSLLKLSLSSMLFFLLFFFFISPSFSAPTYPKNNDLRFSSMASFPKLHAERLIRGLNLFPKDSINTLESDRHLVPGKIVEKKFTFPYLGASSGPSVEELGHHAGYYRLPRSKAAR